MKLIRTFMLALIGSCALVSMPAVWAAERTSTDDIYERMQQTTGKPVIAFDVDDVLVNRKGWLPEKLKGYASICWQVPSKTKLISAGWWCFRNWGTIKKWTLTKTGDQVIDQIADTNKNRGNDVFAMKLKSGQTVAERLKEINALARPLPLSNLIEPLNRAGFEVIIATNQGKSTLDRLIAAGTLPSAENYKLLFTADYDQKHTTIPLVKKPSSHYFIALAKALGKAPGDILFIDDQEKNTQSAAQVGLQVIHHTNVAHTRDQFLEKLQNTTGISQGDAIVLFNKTK
ncbi:hypothetical protein J120_00880 [candidate division TM6 bacterium JCVI TM6SC1]|uniref:FCP1 homology domain-containing protein n=1 Tax=candidate division TM6 bacterium JCVI TM6SC1 TaxID=1306947 RepID=A0A0D2K5J2_9BACT|nr:hypothetical protein J120_00880 [candidate division TM6 bacterium JCVI TM6SC1]